jgi:dTDP-D-glucose 4,6-dehydratase
VCAVVAFLDPSVCCLCSQWAPVHSPPPPSQPHLQKVNLDRLDYCSCLENLDEIKFYKNYKLVKGNICSSDLVNHVLEEEEIDTIMHFAAQTHVDNSFGNSFSFTQNNILGTHVLLESAKLHGIKRFIHVSTDEVYGEGEANQEPMFEDQVLEVQSEEGRKREMEENGKIRGEEHTPVVYRL